MKTTKMVDLFYFDTLLPIRRAEQRLNKDKFGEPIMKQQQARDSLADTDQHRIGRAVQFRHSTISTA